MMLVMMEVVMMMMTIVMLATNYRTDDGDDENGDKTLFGAICFPSDENQTSSRKQLPASRNRGDKPPTLITAKGPHLSPIMVKQGYLNFTTCHI